MRFVPSVILKTRKDLRDALKAKGLTSSTPSLNEFEYRQIIKYPKFGMKHGVNGLDRLYTEKEIDDIVKAVEKHSSTKNTFGSK